MSDDLPDKLSPDQIIGFWGHTNSNGYLSNFYPAEFEVENDLSFPDFKDIQVFKFNCSEQYFMFWKGVVFYHNNPVENGKIMRQILVETNPKMIKALGRRIKGFDLDIWQTYKMDIMYNANFYKYSQDNTLLTQLLNTKDKYLAEASPKDTIWGIGVHPDSSKLLTPKDWRGQNLLGKVLMELRHDLKKQVQGKGDVSARKFKISFPLGNF